VPMWLQHGLVLLLVAGCLWLVVREGVKALKGKQGCTTCKGCDTTGKGDETPHSHAGVGEQPAARVAFISSEALAARAGSRSNRTGMSGKI
jgi:hypothetical protein